MCVHATHIKKIHTQTVHMSLMIFEHEMGIFELRNEDEKRKAFKISQRKTEDFAFLCSNNKIRKCLFHHLVKEKKRDKYIGTRYTLLAGYA